MVIAVDPVAVFPLDVVIVTKGVTDPARGIRPRDLVARRIGGSQRRAKDPVVVHDDVIAEADHRSGERHNRIEDRMAWCSLTATRRAAVPPARR